MRLALRQAARAVGTTHPNPPVGCVLVRDGVVVGAGHTQPPPGPHAEAVALSAAGDGARGATAYVTLEPCAHQGRTPPCASALIAAGVRRVVVATRDPHHVASGGIEALRAAGVATEVGVEAARAAALLEPFLHWARTGFPLVVLKYAMTLDGKTAAATGEARWITGPVARAHVHRLRERLGAVMAGIGTVLADDPLLTVRRRWSSLPAKCRPVRIVVDSRLRIPLDSRLVQTAGEAPLIVACVEGADRARAAGLAASGATVLEIAERDGRVDVARLMAELGRRDITGILLEGGGSLAWSMLEAGLVGRVCAYVAPMLLGGRDAPTPLAGRGFASPAESVALERVAVRRVGRDWRIEGNVAPGSWEPNV
jgi:diaminohydroxyphosphoribosylaminopyrimidine deaminase/5-amino-6-(5-phosphoribosylamino)uracil reductase